MQTVSQKWLDTHNKTITDEGFVEVILTLTDPDVLDDAAFNDNGNIYISDVEQITSEVDKDIIPYATLEQNMWVLDGNREIPPEGKNIFPDTANLTNCARNGDIFTRNAMVYDSILSLSNWRPQEGKSYTIVIDILDDVLDDKNTVTFIADNRFAFENKSVRLKYGTNYITVRARDTITNDMLGSVWLNTPLTIPSIRFKMSIVEHGDYGDCGFVSEITSNGNGEFVTYPTVTMNFSKTHINLIQGVTINWSATYGEYPVDFIVTAYNGNTPVATKEVTGNTESKTVVYLDIVNYNRITISVKKWCLPYHRARIEEVLIGVEKTYSKKEIFSYSHSQEVDPISSTLPKTSISFSVDNIDGTYNPNNLNGLSKYLIERQELKVRYGYKLDGNVEWIKGGTFYISEWDAPQNGLTASFTARDLLEFMTGVYNKGLYNSNGVSLYDLAEDVLTFANLPLQNDGSVKWVIDESLRDVYTVAPLPIDTVANCLQLIAHAGCCVLYQDREGILHIEKYNMVDSDYAITPQNSYSKPEITLSKPCRKIVVPVYEYEIGENITVARMKIKASTDTKTADVVINYSEPVTNIQINTPYGTTVNSAEYYSTSCKLNVSYKGNEGSLTVKGDKLITSTVDTEIVLGEVGEEIRVDNPLITDEERAVVVAEWMRDYITHRQTLSYSWRSDPRMDCLDVIRSQDAFTDNKVIMTNVEYSYNGAFRGRGEGRVI